ncbi:MtrB/PioB family decaheme-associated outer membrane protein [Rhodoferax sp. GW822-FHT02A01]|uniref:MtrB/PioB family decaheme-associated outer membrane protein n=1 Tax=Rhodoferax sp. GW822-FHT02A01 TaxID=3141537 RepID=UPI00315C9DF2
MALLAAFGQAYADDDMDKLTKPDTTSVSVGAAGTSGSRKDRSLWSQYNGYGDSDSAVLLDYEYIRREEATGLWTRSEGRNLGLDNRELNFSREMQSDWKFSIEYSEQVHHDPLTLNTGMQGIGSTNPVTNSVALAGGTNVNLDLKRKSFSLSGLKWISSNLSVEANFKSEDKDGTRLSGVGGYCSNVISPICSGTNSTVAALFLMPEPVNSTTQQFEGAVHYFEDKLSITAGYYGSFYKNDNSTVSLGGIGGVLGAGATQAALATNLSQPVALAPDNQAHQIYLSGTYAFQPTTRANFKVAYTHATQDESFGSLGSGSLGGAVDTTLAQVGLTMRPGSDWTLNFNGRYEQKDDSTRIANYYADSSGTLYTNSPSNSLRMTGKAEALYQFSRDTRGLLAIDYASINRNRPVSTSLVPSDSMAAMRERTNEVGFTAELRRSLSETLNGSLSLRHSERDGYRWYSLDPTTGYAFISYSASSNLSGTFPVTMLDRNRDAVKIASDWMASDALSIQASVEQGTDHYSGPTSAGVNNADTFSVNLDASLKLNDKWALTAYASSGKQTMGMRQDVGYIAELGNLNTTVGLGATAKISSKLELGGNVSFLEDRNTYRINMTTGAAVVNPPSDEIYRSMTLKLYAKYQLDKASEIQFELINQRTEYNQWAWGSSTTPFAYADNSTVSLQPIQNVTFVGGRYVYKFK